MDSDQNPADDLTRGKTLEELKDPNRWSQGPPFLLQSPDSWPERPDAEPPEDHAELQKTAFCGATVTSPTDCGPDDKRYSSWQELMDDTVKERPETKVLQLAQKQSFPEDSKLLAAGKSVSPSSRLLTLTLVLDQTSGLIRVGGQFRRLEDIDVPLHPVVLDAAHPVTHLLIQKYEYEFFQSCGDHSGSSEVDRQSTSINEPALSVNVGGASLRFPRWLTFLMLASDYTNRPFTPLGWIVLGP